MGHRSLCSVALAVAGLATLARPAYAQAGLDPHEALIAAVEEMVLELKQRVREPTRLGKVAVLPLEERLRGATEAGDYVRDEFEQVLSNTGFNLVARDDRALGNLFVEQCKSAQGFTSDETAKSWGRATAADSLIVGHLDQLSTKWRISIRVIQVDSTQVVLVTRRFVPLAAIPQRYRGHRLAAVEAVCKSLAEGDDPPPPPPIEKPESRRRITRPVLEVGVMPWGGFAGGIYFNGGLEPSAKSRFRTEYGIDVRFRPVRSIEESIELWKQRQVEVLWMTVDDFPTEYAALAAGRPRLILQTGWSRGEEALLARRGIETLNDLEGRSVVLTPNTPAHSFLLISLDLAGLDHRAVKLIKARSSKEAADLFIRGRGDAAIVWIPDDKRIKRRLGDDVEVLETTEDANFLIAESLIAKESAIRTDRRRLELLVKGWLRGNAEINPPRSKARRAAARILSESFPELTLAKAQEELRTVRLATYGDNLNFFGLNKAYRGEKGQDLYDYFWRSYRTAGYARGRKRPWNDIVDLSLLQSFRLTGRLDRAEPPPKYDFCRRPLKDQKLLSDKRLNVKFASGKHRLSRREQKKVDRNFGHLAEIYLHDCILIEGNTDSRGDAEYNRWLSLKRAEAVRDYLITRYGFRADRFIVKGNGEDKPLKPNTTAANRAENRRTDFELLH